MTFLKDLQYKNRIKMDEKGQDESQRMDGREIDHVFGKQVINECATTFLQ